MDVFLPDGDGLTSCVRLIDARQHPDVIVITAARDVATVRTAMQLGAVHYLVKPFGFAALSERLQSYRRLRLRIAGLADEADQSDVDELFGILRGPTAAGHGPRKDTRRRPSNWSATPSAPRTSAVSAAEVAERIGISRATAQRYLTYLERHGVVR